MSWSFNPPPGWPVPRGFTPPEGWVPDPQWPRAPQDWTYWVPSDEVKAAVAETEPLAEGEARDASPAAAAATVAASETELDPFRVPPPGQIPQPSPAAYGPPTYGPPSTPPPAYPPPGYGPQGYPPPGYPPAGYPAAGYAGAPAPRRGVRGWVVALIIGVVTLLLVTVVAGIFAVGRLASTTIKPFIQSDMACNDALTEIRDDDVPPTPVQAQAALPGLRDAQARAQESVNKSTLQNPRDVLAPIQDLVQAYEVLAALPSDRSTWTQQQRDQVEQEAAAISRAKGRLDNSCGNGVGSSSNGSGANSVGSFASLVGR